MNLDTQVPVLKVDSKGNGKIDKEFRPTKTLIGDAVKDVNQLIKQERR